MWTIQDVQDVDAWSRYPMWALLNFRINPWSLNQDYPCRVKPQPPLLKSRFCVVPHGINHWSPFWVFFWLLFDISWCPLFAEVKREIKHWFSNLKVPTLDIETSTSGLTLLYTKVPTSLLGLNGPHLMRTKRLYFLIKLYNISFSLIIFLMIKLFIELFIELF